MANHTFATEDLPNLDTVLTKTVSDMDPLDDPDFNAIRFINERFPSDKSLSLVDGYIIELQQQIQELDHEILDAVREQATKSQGAHGDLQEVKLAIRELLKRVGSMKEKATDSEVLVQEICKDIKSLDFAKRNLTSTITAMKRLTMLVAALDQLRKCAAHREYKKAANLILAIKNLKVHFDELKDTPKIKELFIRYEMLFGELQSQILEDFDSLFDVEIDDVQNLNDASDVVDAISLDLRREIVTKYCFMSLEPYKKMFEPGSAAADLENVERRFSWLRRCLKDFDQKHGLIFPQSWKIPCYLAEHFCHFTRQHLVEILSACHNTVDPKLLVQVLRASLDFEEILAKKFQKTIESINTNFTSSQKQSEIPADIIESLPYADEFERNTDYETCLQYESEKKNHTPRFSGIISECFEAYLSSWVNHEEQSLVESLTSSTESDRLIGEKANAEEQESIDDDFHDDDLPRFVFSSASEIFNRFKACVKETVTISTKQTLYEIFQVFKRIIRRYVEILNSRITKKGSLPTSENFVNCICTVVGTAEYCDSTLPQLVSTITKVIDESYVENINLDSEVDLFWNLKAGAVQTLISLLDASIDPILQRMSKCNWETYQSSDVVDCTADISQISTCIGQKLGLFYSYLSIAYYRFVCDKVIQHFLPKYISSIFACKKIGKAGVQQLLMNTNHLRTTLLEAPVVASGGRPMHSGYINYVIRELGKAEGILKVVASPKDNLATLKELLQEYDPSGTCDDVTKILALRSRRDTSQLSEADLQSTFSTSVPVVKQHVTEVTIAPVTIKSAFHSPGTISTGKEQSRELHTIGTTLKEQGLRAAEDMRSLWGRFSKGRQTQNSPTVTDS